MALVQRRQADRRYRVLRGSSFPVPRQGQLTILMDDGTEILAGPGEVTSLPSGHDAWVVGEVPVVTVDWFGAGNYATQPTSY
jgi:hypothetical protein